MDRRHNLDRRAGTLHGRGAPAHTAAAGSRNGPATVVDRRTIGLREGRLDLADYDERLQWAYAARPYQDLVELLADLPRPAVAEHPPAWHLRWVCWLPNPFRAAAQWARR